MVFQVQIGDAGVEQVPAGSCAPTNIIPRVHSKGGGTRFANDATSGSCLMLLVARRGVRSSCQG